MIGDLGFQTTRICFKSLEEAFLAISVLTWMLTSQQTCVKRFELSFKTLHRITTTAITPSWAFKWKKALSLEAFGGSCFGREGFVWEIISCGQSRNFTIHSLPVLPISMAKRLSWKDEMPHDLDLCSLAILPHDTLLKHDELYKRAPSWPMMLWYFQVEIRIWNSEISQTRLVKGRSELLIATSHWKLVWLERSASSTDPPKCPACERFGSHPRTRGTITMMFK